MSEIKRTKPKKRKPGSTFTLRGVDCHRFLRAFDPTFPLHPDEKSPSPPASNAQHGGE